MQIGMYQETKRPVVALGEGGRKKHRGMSTQHGEGMALATYNCWRLSNFTLNRYNVPCVCHTLTDIQSTFHGE
jgi:hypothetical protein